MEAHHVLVLVVGEFTSDPMDERNPFRTAALNGFGNGVIHLRKPVGTIENKSDRDPFTGGLHRPCLVPAALCVTGLTQQTFVAIIHRGTFRYSVGSTRCSA